MLTIARSSTSSPVNSAVVISSAGALGQTVGVTAGQTVKFTYTNVSGITQCGIQLMNGTSQVGYIAQSDGDGQLFLVPNNMTSIGFNVDTLVGSGSLTLNVVSI